MADKIRNSAQEFKRDALMAELRRQELEEKDK
jgi:hypothetical protein